MVDTKPLVSLMSLTNRAYAVLLGQHPLVVVFTDAVFTLDDLFLGSSASDGARIGVPGRSLTIPSHREAVSSQRGAF